MFSPLSAASHSPSGSRSRSEEEDMGDSDVEGDAPPPPPFKPPLGLKPEELYGNPAFMQIYRARIAASMQAAQAARQQQHKAAVGGDAEAAEAPAGYPPFVGEKGDADVSRIFFFFFFLA
jgi:hypothetical protein